MKLFRKPKCPACNKKLGKETTEIRLESSDGVFEMTVCKSCGDMFDILHDKISQKHKTSDMRNEDERF